MIGMYSLESTDACSIMSSIQDILLRINLNTGNCRGQYYDGAARILGARSGVATKLLELEPRALYTHCYDHTMNLAVQGSLKGSKIMADTLDTIYEITKLIKNLLSVKLFLTNLKMFLLDNVEFAFFVPHGGR